VILRTREGTRGEKQIDLQPREFSLLEYLMRNAGRIVSKTMIMEHVWDYHFDPQTNVVEARISWLLDKIDKGSEKKFIHTVRGGDMSLKKLSLFRNRLSFRLTVWYAGIFTVSSLIAFLLFYTFITAVIQERTDQELLNQAVKFSTVLQEQGIGVVEDFALLEAQEAGVRKVFFRLLYPTGQAYSSSNMSHWKDIAVHKAAIEQLLAGNGNVLETVYLRDRQDQVRVLYTLVGPGVILQVGQSMENYIRIIDAFRGIFLITMALLIGLVTGVGWFMARRAVSGARSLPGRRRPSPAERSKSGSPSRTGAMRSINWR
jgi:hypothetical protein